MFKIYMYNINSTHKIIDNYQTFFSSPLYFSAVSNLELLIVQIVVDRNRLLFAEFHWLRRDLLVDSNGLR